MPTHTRVLTVKCGVSKPWRGCPFRRVRIDHSCTRWTSERVARRYHPIYRRCHRRRRRLFLSAAYTGDPHRPVVIALAHRASSLIAGRRSSRKARVGDCFHSDALIHRAAVVVAKGESARHSVASTARASVGSHSIRRRLSAPGQGGAHRAHFQLCSGLCCWLSKHNMLWQRLGP